MPILTIQKPSSKTIKVEINLDQWERLADVFGFYQPRFLRDIKKSLRESKNEKTQKIEFLHDLDVKK